MFIFSNLQSSSSDVKKRMKFYYFYVFSSFTIVLGLAILQFTDESTTHYVSFIILLVCGAVLLLASLTSLILFILTGIKVWRLSKKVELSNQENFEKER